MLGFLNCSIVDRSDFQRGNYGRWFLLFFTLLAGTSCLGATKAPRPLSSKSPEDAAKGDATLPSIFIVGDSTAARLTEPQEGWGVPFADFFDPTKINVLNYAMPGRSSRTYLTEGWWAMVAKRLKPGDLVLLQFGHNDRSPVNDASRARGSLPGIGDETEEIDNLLTRRVERVGTYGYYLREFVDAVRAAKAVPVILSPTVRFVWNAGRVERDVFNYAAWARAVALEKHVEFVEVKTRLADHYEQLGEQTVRKFFPRDTVHTGKEGAAVTAGIILFALNQKGIVSFNRLSKAGAAYLQRPPTELKTLK